MGKVQHRFAPTRVPQPAVRDRLPRLLIVGLVVASLFVSSIPPSLAQDATPTPGGAAVTSENIELSIPANSRYQPNSVAPSTSASTPTWAPSTQSNR